MLTYICMHGCMYVCTLHMYTKTTLNKTKTTTTKLLIRKPKKKKKRKERKNVFHYIEDAGVKCDDCLQQCLAWKMWPTLFTIPSENSVTAIGMHATTARKNSSYCPAKGLSIIHLYIVHMWPSPLTDANFIALFLSIAKFFNKVTFLSRQNCFLWT